MPPYLQGLRGSITSFSQRVLIRATVLEAHMPPYLQGLRGSITSFSQRVLIRATVLEGHMPPYLQGLRGIYPDNCFREPHASLRIDPDD